MPQFDLNLLNFQNILVYVFCISYLYYLKEINFYFFYFFKLPYQLNLYLFLVFFKKKWNFNNWLKFVLKATWSNFKKMKFLLFVLSVENNYLVYFLITTMFLNFLSIDTFNFISLNFFFDIISSISSLSTTSIMDFFLNFINLNSNTLDYNFS